MRFFWTAGLIFGIFVKAFSQSALVLDTLRAHTSFYVTGDALDSSLRNSRSSLSNLYLRDGIFFDPFRIYQPFGTFLQRYNSTERLPVFSALPFLGVHYSFGMQGSQHTALNYFQAFNHGWLANFRYTSNASAGFIRNSGWKNRDLHAMVLRYGPRYRTQMTLTTQSDLRNFSGGIVSDSLLQYIAIGLIPVRKDSCSSDVRLKELSWKNEYNLLQDTTRFLGIYHRSSIQNFRRSYKESDTLSGLYPAIFYDSLRSLDILEQTLQKNALGIGSTSRHWQFEALATADYWRFRMRGNQRDTLELGLTSAMKYHVRNTSLKINYQYRFFGAFNASQLSGALSHRFLRKHLVSANFIAGLVAPEVFQRFYFGNTFQWSMQQAQLQRILQGDLAVQGELFDVAYRVQVKGLLTQGVYCFNGSVWDNHNGQSNQQLMEFQLALGKTWKGFSVEPKGYYLAQKNRVLPNLGAGIGMKYQGYLGKSKNLFVFTQVNYMYYQGYRTLSLVPQLSLLDLSAANLTESKYHSLNALMGFKVKTFQFHVALDNLGTFFMPTQQMLYKDIPIPTWQLKMGVTWVFWN